MDLSIVLCSYSKNTYDKRWFKMEISCYKIIPCVFFPAALIQGNRNNCAQFSCNLDWLISKLDRLESSSGETHCYDVN